MDMYCHKCGEPWDNDTFHEAADEQDSTYTEVVRKFQRVGCEAIGWSKCSPTPSTETDPHYGLTRQDAAMALADLLGDDTDGIMAEMEDLFG